MNSRLRQDEIAIDRLIIRGSANFKNRLTQELNQASWPMTKDESWIFIRQMHVTAPAKYLSRQLVKHTQDELGHAQHPRSNSNVVRFSNLQELLAYLLTDIAYGQVANQWYWQRWKYLFNLSASAAIKNLLTEHLTEITTVTHSLSRLGSLEKIWHALDNDHATQLIAELSWTLGLSIPDPLNFSQSTNITIKLASGLLTPYLRRWHPVVRVLKPESPAYILSLILIAQEVAPLVLKNAPEVVLSKIHQQLQLEVAKHQVLFSDKATASKIAKDNQHAELFKKQAGKQTARRNSDSSNNLNISKGNTSLVDKENSQIETKPAEIAATTSTVLQHHESDSDIIKKASIERDIKQKLKSIQLNSNNALPVTSDTSLDVKVVQSNDHSLFFETPAFHTGQGGLFYLLNFLNRHEIQVLMNQHWQQLPSAWAWLYRMGQLLNLDESDAVVDFLAQQLGLESVLQLQDLNALPAVNEILRFSQHWYAKTEVWNPDLLLLDATINYTPSHIDIHASLNCVRLPVRLAGLDINPGWLPWLGRVVHFHYDA